MWTNAFIGQPAPPGDAELESELGAASALWRRLLSDLGEEYGLVTQEWNSYSKKAGWSLRLKHKDRNIVYLSPGHGCFLASFALGDQAVREAKATPLPKSVLDLIGNAKRYAEGTAVRLEVRRANDLAAVKKLVGIKLAN